MFLNQKELQKLKTTYQKGMRIELIRMSDDPHPVPSGTLGTVRFVDDIGTIHVSWDIGSSLGLIPGIDEFRLVQEN
jgi:hypothetical protein